MWIALNTAPGTQQVLRKRHLLFFFLTLNQEDQGLPCVHRQQLMPSHVLLLVPPGHGRDRGSDTSETAAKLTKRSWIQSKNNPWIQASASACHPGLSGGHAT